jgi:hypothetical protein
MTAVRQEIVAPLFRFQQSLCLQGKYRPETGGRWRATPLMEGGNLEALEIRAATS